MAHYREIDYPRRRRIPLLLWPIVLLWRLVTFAANLMGILVTILLGLALMGVGLLLISTIAGFIIGVPLFILGFLLVIRGLY